MNNNPSSDKIKEESDTRDGFESPTETVPIETIPKKGQQKHVSQDNVTSQPHPLLIPARFKKGDRIGQYYEVYDILGAGGNGIVYLVYSNLQKKFFALKTYLDKFFLDESVKEKFKREIEVWIKLEAHPNLIQAFVAEEIFGQLYIQMEYIRPFSDEGINTLEGYIKKIPISFHKTVEWGIQFCNGIEFAYQHGVRCHGDIKPSNIMITPDEKIKITDFGLAVIFDDSLEPGDTIQNSQDSIAGNRSGSRRERSVIFGTPTHMSPELYSGDYPCDVRSDIYSFGIVLYQMVSGGKMPFIAPFPTDNSNEEKVRFWKEMQKLHTEIPIPELNSPLFPLIKKCLEKSPEKRYQNFTELRQDIEKIGNVPQSESPSFVKTSDSELPIEESCVWGNKALSCFWIDQIDEAFQYLAKSLEIEPKNVSSMNIMGLCYVKREKYTDAIEWFDRATELAPNYAEAWNNKGFCYNKMGNREKAFSCFSKATDLNPNYADAWGNQGEYFAFKGKYSEAVRCFDLAIQACSNNPHFYMGKINCLLETQRIEEAFACIDIAFQNCKNDFEMLYYKGQILYGQGKFREAKQCFDDALSLAPKNPDAWNNKGLCCTALKEFDTAHSCFLKAINLNPDVAEYYNNNGTCFHKQGFFYEAIENFNSAIQIQKNFAEVWGNKGLSYDGLCEYFKAIECYDKAIQCHIESGKPTPHLADVWINKGSTLNSLKQYKDAMICFEEALKINPFSAVALYNIGWSLVKLGREKEASVYLHIALQLDPNVTEQK